MLLQKQKDAHLETLRRPDETMLELKLRLRKTKPIRPPKPLPKVPSIYPKRSTSIKRRIDTRHDTIVSPRSHSLNRNGVLTESISPIVPNSTSPRCIISQLNVLEQLSGTFKLLFLFSDILIITRSQDSDLFVEKLVPLSRLDINNTNDTNVIDVSTLEKDVFTHFIFETRDSNLLLDLLNLKKRVSSDISLDDCEEILDLVLGESFQEQELIKWAIDL